ncbi:hypothetical protein M0R72_02615 [Candidatus Pacearchaeota archaeon]|jgi:hypothetical protein|nr:hypothetical protein [Candidatus Pacearchaeota archaeon]
MKTLKTTIQAAQKKITNNTQRVGIRLLSADGEWLPRSSLSRIPSATARVRDLRKDEFGSFKVECKSSTDLSRKTSKRTFYYRINPNKVTQKQIQTLFPAE